MLQTLLAAVWLAAQASPAQNNPFQEVVFAVNATLYRGDGTPGGSAGNSGVDGTSGYVWIASSFCGSGASGTPPAERPAVGWRYSGRVVDRTADAMTVAIEWERVPDQSTSTATTLPKGSTTATLRAGDRVELDRAVPTGPADCGTALVKLEASMGTRSMVTVVRGDGSVVRIEPRGGGSSSASVGARPSAGGGGGGGGVRIGGAAGAGRASAAVVNADAPYEAELWLVHVLPDKTEAVERRTVRFGQGPGAFAFPTIQLTADKVNASVAITGSIRLVHGSGGSPVIQVGIERRVKAAGEPDRVGNGYRRLELPSPADLLAFELPSSPPSGGDSLYGHQFSLRLRVSPRAAPR